MSARDGLAALGRVVRQQLALALRQPRRDDDVDEHVEITPRTRPAEMRHAATAQADLRAGLGPGPDLDVLVAVDGRDGDRRAEGGLGDRDVRLVDQLGALAPQRRVRRDVDRDVE